MKEAHSHIQAHQIRFPDFERNQNINCSGSKVARVQYKPVTSIPGFASQFRDRYHAAAS